jgi:hypothetical protein
MQWGVGKGPARGLALFRMPTLNDNRGSGNCAPLAYFTCLIMRPLYERKEMTKTDIAKNVASVVVGLGTAKIVSGVIARNTSRETVTDKVAVGSAGLVVGAMATDATKSYTDRKIDEFILWWKQNAI